MHHHVRHPLGREFFMIDVESFEGVARKLKSPLIRSKSPESEDLKIGVNLVEELKDNGL